MDVSTLFNEAPVGILVVSSDGTIVLANKTLAAQLDTQPDDLAGHDIQTIFSLATKIFYQTHLLPMLKLQHSAQEIFVTLRSSRGKDVPVMLNVNVSKAFGEPVYLYACNTVYQRQKYEDEILLAKRTAEEALLKNEALIHAKQELEKNKEELDIQLTKLEQRNNELQQLNDIVAHDLQEAVRKISIFSGQLLDDKDSQLTEKAVTSFNTIIRSAYKLKDVLKSLQDYMNIASFPGKFELVDLHKVAVQQFNTVSNQFANVVCKASINHLPVVRGIAVQLDILFYQLIKNCFAFRNPVKPLHININSTIIQENIYYTTRQKYRYADHTVITIQDNGQGFQPKYEEHIFKILKKADNNNIGLGFGLAICKRIIENHGGRITATAQPDKGAVFKILLPKEVAATSS